ncbi:MAG: peptidylprolyl isomerase [Methanobacteriota archaeon]
MAHATHMRPRLVLALLVTPLLAGCLGLDGGEPGDDGAGFDVSALSTKNPVVVFETGKGRIVVELFEEMTPITVANFLNLSATGFYDGTRFHRVLPGFVIQGGDPNTRSGAPSTWGGGSPGHTIPDEFHARLRHNQSGMLSMAHAGPNTGGSQFFVTLAPTPNLDDRHSVFGRVILGMDVVADIADDPTTDNGRGEKSQPVSAVAIDAASVHRHARTPATEPHGLRLYAPRPEHGGGAGRASSWIVVLANDGDVRDNVTVTATAPAGWNARVEEGFAAFTANARQSHAFVVEATPPADAPPGPATITVTARSTYAGVSVASTTLTLVVGEIGASQVRRGDSVTANYVGVVTDGRLFDTSVDGVARNSSYPKFAVSGGFQLRGSYQTFQFSPGSGVIEGFTDLALGMRAGETKAGRIPAAKAYSFGSVYERPLTGKTLLFELEITKRE